MTPDREQLKRECADALEVLQREQRVDGLAALADRLRALGEPYRFHGELMLVALLHRNDNTITWHLIHVLEKLEKET
jgi:hypothetical protein